MPGGPWMWSNTKRRFGRVERDPKQLDLGCAADESALPARRQQVAERAGRPHPSHRGRIEAKSATPTGSPCADVGEMSDFVHPITLRIAAPAHPRCAGIGWSTRSRAEVRERAPGNGLDQAPRTRRRSADPPRRDHWHSRRARPSAKIELPIRVACGLALVTSRARRTRRSALRPSGSRSTMPARRPRRGVAVATQSVSRPINATESRWATASWPH